MFFDPEFGFKADNKLIAKVVASLTYEFCDNSDQKRLSSLIDVDVISTKIVFVYTGAIDVYYKDHADPLLNFDNGSYFGDISYIFKAKN